jgi:hypothetical protein
VLKGKYAIRSRCGDKIRNIKNLFDLFSNFRSGCPSAQEWDTKRSSGHYYILEPQKVNDNLSEFALLIAAAALS